MRRRLLRHSPAYGRDHDATLRMLALLGHRLSPRRICGCLSVAAPTEACPAGLGGCPALTRAGCLCIEAWVGPYFVRGYTAHSEPRGPSRTRRTRQCRCG